MPRDKDKPMLTKKQRLAKSIRDARKIAKLNRDVDGFSHVRTWGKKRVFEVRITWKGETFDNSFIPELHPRHADATAFNSLRSSQFLKAYGIR